MTWPGILVFTAPALVSMAINTWCSAWRRQKCELQLLRQGGHVTLLVRCWTCSVLPAPATLHDSCFADGGGGHTVERVDRSYAVLVGPRIPGAIGPRQLGVLPVNAAGLGGQGPADGSRSRSVRAGGACPKLPGSAHQHVIWEDGMLRQDLLWSCLLYTSDAADE